MNCSDRQGRLGTNSHCWVYQHIQKKTDVTLAGLEESFMGLRGFSCLSREGRAQLEDRLQEEGGSKQEVTRVRSMDGEEAAGRRCKPWDDPILPVLALSHGK